MKYFNRLMTAIKWLHNEYSRINKEYKANKTNVKLGRSFSLGGPFGYHFAKNMFRNTKYNVIVDTAITLDNRKQPLYPDIILLKDGTLKAIIELKLALGFLHPDYLKGFSSKQRKIRNASSFTYNIKDELGEIFSSEKIEVNRSFKKLAVVITEQNDHGRSTRFEKVMKNNGYKTLFILNKSGPWPHEFKWDDIKKEINDNKNKINKMFMWLLK